MRVAWAGAAVAVLAVAVWIAAGTRPSRVVRFPAGVTEVHAEIVIDRDTEVRGTGGRTVLRAAPDFQGRAILVVRGDGVSVHDLEIDGNRDAVEARAGLPPHDVPFARFTRGNGVLAEGVANLTVENVGFRRIAGFAVLVSRGRRVAIEHVRITDSGGRNAAGRNNTTGGILIEEGSTEFRVSRCELRAIRGNGIWTHSLYTSPRNAHGVFEGNVFDTIGRDALQAGHAMDMRIERNQGVRIGYPAEEIDVEARAVPVAVDTAGDVGASVYAGNVFREINGKCIDLDGFHDGVVRDNVCVNVGGYGIVMNNTNPDMRPDHLRIERNRIEGALYGGVFVIGSGNVVSGNRLLDLNRAHCNEEAARSGCYYAPGEPDMLQTGIYLGSGAERPALARGNTIERNEVTGWKMAERCVGHAPPVLPDWNVVRENNCR